MLFFFLMALGMCRRRPPHHHHTKGGGTKIEMTTKNKIIIGCSVSAFLLLFIGIATFVFVQVYGCCECWNKNCPCCGSRQVYTSSDGEEDKLEDNVDPDGKVPNGEEKMEGGEMPPVDGNNNYSQPQNNEYPAMEGNNNIPVMPDGNNYPQMQATNDYPAYPNNNNPYTNGEVGNVTNSPNIPENSPYDYPN